MTFAAPSPPPATPRLAGPAAEEPIGLGTDATSPPPTPPLPPLTAGLVGRLEWCAERVGGKRKLAERAEISESQLYRYLEPGAALPHDRLLAIAAAAEINPAWLLTGVGEHLYATSYPRPAFRPELLISIQEQVEMLLLEYQKHISPTQKSRIISYLYDILRYEEAQAQHFITLDKFKTLVFISFLAEMKSDAEIDILREIFDLLMYRSKTETIDNHHQLLTT